MEIIYLVKKHIQNTKRAKKIIAIIFLILCINHIGGWITKFFINVGVKFTPEYIFNGVWSDIPVIIERIWLPAITLLPTLDFLMVLIGLFCFRRLSNLFIKDYWVMMEINSSSITSSSWWFYYQRALVHIAYGLWIVFSYTVSYFLFHYLRINSLLIFAVFAAIGYPVYYFMQSLLGLMATIPLSNQDRTQKLKYLYSFNAIKTLYLFYSTRLGLELLLAFILPLMLTKLQVMEFLVPWLVFAGLCIPFTFLRSLSYEIKLYIFRGDEKIKSIFEGGIVKF